MQEKLEIAKNLGFIAKLNKIDRLPVNDKKFQDLIGSPNCLFTVGEISKLLTSWVSGWDSCNLEYKRYAKQSKS